MADYNVTVSLGGVAPSTGVYLVTAYGADPTGVADSSSAFQSTLNAAGASGGGTVVVPAGTYNIGTAITYSSTSPLRVVSDGAWLDGNDTTGNAFVIYNGGGAGYPTYEHIEFSGMWFRGFTGSVVMCSTYDTAGRTTVNRLVVTGCKFDGCGYGLLFKSKIGSSEISGNVFTDLQSSSSDGASAINIGSKYDVDMAYTGNIIIRNNVVNGATATASAAEQYAIVAFGYNVSITGNIVKDSTSSTGAALGIAVKSRYVDISGNILDNAGSGNDGHIYVKGLGRGDGTTGNNGGESYSINICNNVIRSTATTAYNTTESGISVDGGSDGKDNVNICGNYIEGLRGNGIKVEGTGAHDDITIRGNNIYGVRRDYGIRCVTTGKRLIVADNKIGGFGVDGSQTNPIGIRIDPVGDTTVLVVTGNVISDDGIATGSGTVYGMFIRPSAGTLSRMCIKRNLVDLTTSRAQIGIYTSVTGTGVIGSGEVSENTVYVTSGQTAYSHGATSNSSSINGTATASPDDTTPSVLGLTHLLIPANTVATAITQLDDGVAGQQVTLVFTSGTNPSTIADSGNFLLYAAWSPTVDDTITLFTANGTTWREIARSAN